VIEFRASCGHSIRAREDDAVKTVTCNFCGASAQAPDPTGSALDYLFTEVEEAQQRSSVNDAIRSRDSGPAIPIIGNLVKQNDPIKLVMTFVYIGIVLIVIGVGGKYLYQSVIKPMLAEKSAPIAGTGSQVSPTGNTINGLPAPNPVQPMVSRRPYPMLQEGATGIYVTSIPAGADVFMRTVASNTNPAVPLGEDPKENKGQTPLMLAEDTPGEYVIAVSVTSASPELMKLPKYKALRRSLMGGGNAFAAAEAYFIPDGSTELRVVSPPRVPPTFVREYRVTVRKDRWSPVCAFFLPDSKLSELVPYLPKKKAYNVDEERLEAEFDLYNVAPKDRPLVLKVIENIGAAVYRTPDDQYQVLQLLPDPNEFFNGFAVTRKSNGG